MTKQELIKELAIRACEGRLAFFIGAGFSKAVMGQYASGPKKGKDRALSWIDLLSEVAKRFGVENVIPYEKCVHPFDCPQIASVMVKEIHGKSGAPIEECEARVKDCVCQLTNWYPNKNRKVGWADIFDAIHPSVIVTTNYDHVLEDLLEENAVSLSSTDALPTSFDEEYLIYHIHGVRNRPDDIVLTREDYIEAMRPFSYRQIRLTTLLRENSVLYLGYGRNDLNILSALDVAQQTFPDLKDGCFSSIHVQVERDGVGADEIVESMLSNKAIALHVFKTREIKTFLFELAGACKDREKEILTEYDFFERLKKLVSAEDSRGNKKQLQQRRVDIFNVFENNVKLLNEPTKVGRRMAYAFDDFIKEHYRDLFAEAHHPGNWERYADMWALLYAYFSMFSPRYMPHDGEAHNQPMPYTRRFGYALGWFNGLARFVGTEKGMSRQAWDCFIEDWPKLSQNVKELIVLSANRSGYNQILDLIKRSPYKNDLTLNDDLTVNKSARNS